MLKKVYQHTMSEKSKKVAASIDAFFEKNLSAGDYLPIFFAFSVCKFMCNLNPQ